MRNLSHLSLDMINFPFDLLVKILCTLGWVVAAALLHLWPNSWSSRTVSVPSVQAHMHDCTHGHTQHIHSFYSERERWALCSDASQVIAVSVSTEGSDFWWCELFLVFSCSLARNADGNSTLGVPLSCWAFWLKFQMCDLSLSSPSVPASIRAGSLLSHLLPPRDGSRRTASVVAGRRGTAEGRRWPTSCWW